MKTTDEAKEELILITRNFTSLSLAKGKSGNISVRVPKGILITPSSIAYEKLKPNDLVLISLNGDLLSEKKNQHQSIMYPRLDHKT